MPEPPAELPDRVDLLVLGSGSAASKVATSVAETGERVLLIENRDFGGTCALRGCNPKKVMTRAAGLVDYAQRMRGRYLSESVDISLDWEAMRAFQQTFTEPIPSEKTESLHEAGVQTVREEPRLTGPNSVTLGGRTVRFDRLVIGTGAKPREPDFPGAEHAITSDDFLTLDRPPQSIVFLGGGYISSEFAHVAHVAGSSVSIVERGPQILDPFDADLVAALEANSRSRGMAIYTQSEVRAIERGEQGHTVTIESERGGQTLQAECVVQALGRVPAIDTLDLEAADIAFGERGICVDRQCRSTSQRHVWAVGDCADHGQPMLTPTANETGRAVARQLTGDESATPDFGPIPFAAFTLPPIAGVGLSEPAARDKYGDDLTLNSGEMTDWTTFRKLGAEAAYYKTLVQTSTGKLVGAHLLGPDAPELINLFALALKFGLTRRDLKSVLFTYPTLSHEVRAMV